MQQTTTRQQKKSNKKLQKPCLVEAVDIYWKGTALRPGRPAKKYRERDKERRKHNTEKEKTQHAMMFSTVY